jgi:RNA polymerase sigma-70 factor, ECF subfamily
MNEHRRPLTPPPPGSGLFSPHELDSPALNSQKAAADRPDFTALVGEHWTAVFRLAHALTGDAHAAEDVTQETFLRAWKRFDTFQPGTRLRAWLFRIATNACFDEERKRRRGPTEPLTADAPASGPAPGQALETAERCAILRAALDGLSELTRLVFHLRAQEDLSFREIAEIAGTTEQAARWHMHHARTKLLDRLGDDF